MQIMFFKSRSHFSLPLYERSRWMVFTQIVFPKPHLRNANGEFSSNPAANAESEDNYKVRYLASPILRSEGLLINSLWSLSIKPRSGCYCSRESRACMSYLPKFDWKSTVPGVVKWTVIRKSTRFVCMKSAAASGAWFMICWSCWLNHKSTCTFIPCKWKSGQT